MSEADYVISVALYLHGFDLNPDAVSEALGIRPDRSWHRGERQHGKKTGRVYVRKAGLWVLEAKVNPESSNVADYLDALLSRIDFDAEALAQLGGLEEAYVDIFVATTSDEEFGGAQCELGFSPTQIERLARLGVPVNLTVDVSRP